MHSCEKQNIIIRIHLGVISWDFIHMHELRTHKYFISSLRLAASHFLGQNKFRKYYSESQAGRDIAVGLRLINVIVSRIDFLLDGLDDILSLSLQVAWKVCVRLRLNIRSCGSWLHNYFDVKHNATLRCTVRSKRKLTCLVCIMYYERRFE